MDAFWCITLGTIIVAWFWKRERNKAYDRKTEQMKYAKKHEEVKQAEVIAKYTEAFGKPMTKAEKEAEAKAAKFKADRDKQEAELRKQGYTDELIAVILPTINNGQ